MWEIARERDEIVKTGKVLGPFEEGKLSRSLVENIRRAVRRLAADKRVILSKRKFTTFEEVFHFNQFLSSRLEVLQLRQNMSADVEEYVQRTLSPDSEKLDYDKDQLEILREEDPDNYRKMLELWLVIERGIAGVFPRIESNQLGPWIDILIRGRHIFELGSRGFRTPLLSLIDGLRKQTKRDDAEQMEILNLLHELSKQISANERWKIGRIKNKFHTFLNTQKYTRASIGNELKGFLYDKNPTLISSLPGHHEPSTKGIIPSIKFGETFYPERVYSPILDELFDRQIYRNHLFVSLN